MKLVREGLTVVLVAMANLVVVPSEASLIFAPPAVPEDASQIGFANFAGSKQLTYDSETGVMTYHVDYLAEDRAISP